MWSTAKERKVTKNLGRCEERRNGKNEGIDRCGDGRERRAREPRKRAAKEEKVKEIEAIRASIRFTIAGLVGSGSLFQKEGIVSLLAKGKMEEGESVDGR